MKTAFALVTLMVASNFAYAQFKPKEVRYDVKIIRRGDMVGFEKCTITKPKCA